MILGFIGTHIHADVFMPTPVTLNTLLKQTRVTKWLIPVVCYYQIGQRWLIITVITMKLFYSFYKIHGVMTKLQPYLIIVVLLTQVVLAGLLS